MSCARCQELLSDHLEGALGPPLSREVSEHLASCETCRELSDSVAELTRILARSAVPEPPADLTERILARTLPHVRARAPRTRRQTGLLPSGWPAAASWVTAAAVFALVLLWRPPQALSHWSREVSRTARQVYSFGVRTASDAERFLAELNVLRMTVGVAFEDRLDRLNERLRALDEARRKSSEEAAPEREPDSSSRGPGGPPVASRTPFAKRSFT